MKWLRRKLARIYDIPNAFRVLDIIDGAGGVDIVEAFNVAGKEIEGFYGIRLKHWISEDDAKTLRKITLHQLQYKDRKGLGSRIFWRIFRNYREGCRILKDWE